MSAPLVLYDYWRSSASYRVRIALNLKGLAYEQRSVHLAKGEQKDEAYIQLNPQGLVPYLIDGDVALSQSLAMIEYLDERHPTPPLLPQQAEGRAITRAMAQLIACDTHPLNNLRILKYLTGKLAQDDEAKTTWIHRWIAEGFSALESLVLRHGSDGHFCYGIHPTLADCCLIPQLYNARRFGCDLNPYPTLTKIEGHCLTLEAFMKAVPENQPDAQPAS